MVCLYCGQKTQIVNSRPQARSRTTWRRHHCPACGGTFTTQERVDLATAVAFVAKDGRLQPFRRETLLQSVYQSLRHRPDVLTEALDLSDTVITKLLPQLQDGALTRHQVITTTAQALKRFDKAAWVSYTAYYPIDKS